mgnify:CR=1 FL=1
MTDRRHSFVVATVAVMAAAMCGVSRAQDAALIAAAKKEGEVVWYTGLVVNQVVRPLMEAFEKKYGIPVKMTSVGMQAELVLKVTNEMRSGRPAADVIEGGGQMIPPLVAAGAIERYTPPSAANYAPEFKSKDGYWTVSSVNYVTAAINTDQIKPDDAPRTYQNLLDPKWRGKMVWSADLNNAGAPGFIGNILMSMGEGPGMAYLKALVGQKVTPLTVNQRVVLDQVIAGQYPLALTTFYHHGVISRAQGAPVQWIPLEPVIAVGNVSALVKNAPHPNAARLFLDFLLSDEGQTVFRDASYIPAHPSIASKLPPLKPGGEKFKLLLISPEMSAEHLPNWTKIYTELFQ